MLKVLSSSFNKSQIALSKDAIDCKCNSKESEKNTKGAAASYQRRVVRHQIIIAFVSKCAILIVLLIIQSLPPTASIALLLRNRIALHLNKSNTVPIAFVARNSEESIEI